MNSIFLIQETKFYKYPFSFLGMQDFLWHSVSEQEKEEIKKEAKHLMDKFAKALEKVEKELVEQVGVKREKQLREEKIAGSDVEFKKLFFKNVPEKEENFVKAERGKWK